MLSIHAPTLLASIWWFGGSPLVEAFAPQRPAPHHVSSIHNMVEDPNRPIESQSQSYIDYFRATSGLVSTPSNGEIDADDSSDDDDDIDLPPLFVDVESDKSSMQSTIESGATSSEDVSPSLSQSIERVKERYNTTGTASNDDMLKKIVQIGIQFQQNQQTAGDTAKNENGSSVLSFPNMEKVPGCIATVHLKTTLIQISDSNDTTKEATDYHVTIDGTADAMLSGGLLAVLADTFKGESVTANDILKLDPDTLTTTMGLSSVLSRGRNDGMASMVRVVQRQINSLLDEADETSDATEDERLNELLQSTSISSNTENQNGSTAHKPKVAMLLSGGVDSSVALHLLLRQGYNVTAFYLRIWLEDELAHLGECPWEEDLQVCQAVCEHAGNVPLETVSLGKEYREQVVQYTIEEAQRGRTPNPDIMCNSRVKFGCFLEYIETSGMNFDHVASGHYARLEDVVPADDTDDGEKHPKKRLFRAPDPVKDQSYFLCALTQKQLSTVLFPIGGYQKSEVRELANHFELPNRNRPDSQGLCFLGKVRFDDFLASYLGNQPGDVVDALNGEVIGRHNGMWYHTVGQRKGIGKVMFPLATARGPWYVVAKDQKRDIVYVSNRYEEEDFARARSEFEVEDVRWILAEPPVDARAEGDWKEVRVDMKIRHGPRIVQGQLTLKGDGSTGNISLDKKDGGLAPGQYVVFYELGTDECLGAGVISEKHWAKFLQNYEELVASKTEEGVVTA